ncbi:MAG: NF038129 family PEP-CTERM protein [Pseudomonadota bacterium]
MFNFKHFIKHAALALALACGTTAAYAGPTYNVAINTAGFAGSGLIDFSFLSADGTSPATASLSNFGGAFGAEIERYGDVVGDTATGLVFTNTDGFNYLALNAAFGNMLSFYITFSDGFAGPDQATFAISLYDGLGEFLSNPVQFTLLASDADSPTTLDIQAENIASITEVALVPEPSQLLLLLTALAIMGAMARRKRLG